jgi:hypothetical protein
LKANQKQERRRRAPLVGSLRAAQKECADHYVKEQREARTKFALSGVPNRALKVNSPLQNLQLFIRAQIPFSLH